MDYFCDGLEDSDIDAADFSDLCEDDFGVAPPHWSLLCCNASSSKSGSVLTQKATNLAESALVPMIEEQSVEYELLTSLNQNSVDEFADSVRSCDQQQNNIEESSDICSSFSSRIGITREKKRVTDFSDDKQFNSNQSPLITDEGVPFNGQGDSTCTHLRPARPAPHIPQIQPAPTAVAATHPPNVPSEEVLEGRSLVQPRDQLYERPQLSYGQMTSDNTRATSTQSIAVACFPYVPVIYFAALYNLNPHSMGHAIYAQQVWMSLLYESPLVIIPQPISSEDRMGLPQGSSLSWSGEPGSGRRMRKAPQPASLPPGRRSLLQNPGRQDCQAAAALLRTSKHEH